MSQARCWLPSEHSFSVQPAPSFARGIFFEQVRAMIVGPLLILAREYVESPCKYNVIDRG